MPQTPNDIFRLKATERDCSRCSGGRLYVEKINDLKAKHYCDGCDWFEIYSIEPEPMTRNPSPHLPENKMSESYPHGLEKTQYRRWLNCGKPDVEAFKKAGCPTPKKWAELRGEDGNHQGAASDDGAPAPNRNQPRPAAGPPACVPGTQETAVECPEQLELTTEGSVKVKLIAVQCEGDPDQVLGSIAELVRKLL